MERAFDFIANTADAAVVVDRRQRIVLWNDAARDLLGFDAGEVIGKACYELLGGSDATGCPLCKRGCDAQQAVVRGETLPTRDVQLMTKTGGRVWASVTTVGFPSRRHELSLLAHLMRDATQRRDLELSYEQLVRRVDKWEQNGSEACSTPALPPALAQRLTPREVEVLRLLASGASTERIADRLSIGKATVRTHVQRVLDKLGVHSRLEAVAVGLRHGPI